MTRGKKADRDPGTHANSKGKRNHQNGLASVSCLVYTNMYCRQRIPVSFSNKALTRTPPQVASLSFLQRSNHNSGPKSLILGMNVSSCSLTSCSFVISSTLLESSVVPFSSLSFSNWFSIVFRVFVGQSASCPF